MTKTGRSGRDGAQEIGEVVGVGRREQHLRRPADAEPGDVGKRLVGGEPAAQLGQRRCQLAGQIGKAHSAPPARIGSAAEPLGESVRPLGAVAGTEAHHHVAGDRKAAQHRRDVALARR